MASLVWRTNALSSSINHHGNYSAMSTNVDTKLQLWRHDERPVSAGFQPSFDSSFARKILAIKYTRISYFTHSISFTFRIISTWTFHPIGFISSVEMVEISIYFIIRILNKYKIFPLEILFDYPSRAGFELSNRVMRVFQLNRNTDFFLRRLKINIFPRCAIFFNIVHHQSDVTRAFLWREWNIFRTIYFHWTLTLHTRVALMFEIHPRKLVALFAHVYKGTICTKCFLLL